MTEPRLRLLQHWMKAVVTEHGGLEEGLRAASEQHGLSLQNIVAEKRGLSAQRRMSIYTSGYVLRLLECLRADFPALRRFLCDAVFDAFAGAYIISRPPVSHSLFDLGAGFPGFLSETKPKATQLDAELAAWLDLPPELARLERARSEVMRARGTEQDPHANTFFSPLAIFSEELTFQATPCLRLLELKFPLVDFLNSSDRGERPEPPALRHTFAAVGRFNYRVHLQELKPWQSAFLKACEHPSSLYSIAQHSAHESGTDEALVLGELTVWLPLAVGFGFLKRV